MIARVTWIDYTVDNELGVLVRLCVRGEDGEKYPLFVEGTEPYMFAPSDANIPDYSHIEYTEGGYESLFGHDLQKVVTDTPKQAGALSDEFYWTGEADVPYYRRVSIHDGLSGYIELPDDVDEFIHIDEIDTDPTVKQDITPRISISDIEVRVPEDGTFDEMTEEANQPINVICSYDNYEEKYSVFFYNKYNNLDASKIRDYMSQQLEGTEIENYLDSDIELIESDSEAAMLRAYCDYMENRQFDVVSGWNFTDFDYEYIIDRMNNLNSKGKNIHPSWLSPFDKSGYSHNNMMLIKGLPSFDMMRAFCFSGDTEVLTPNGVRNIKDIEVGDVVYTLNEDTHQVEVKPVTDTHITENKWGNLEHHTGRSHNFKVTPNHRFYLPDKPEKSRSELSPEDYSYKEYRDISQNEKRYKFPEHRPKSGVKKKKFNLGKEEDVIVGAISEKNGMWLRNKLNSDDNSKVELTHGTSKRFGFDTRVGKYRIPARVYRENSNIIEDYADYLFVKSDAGTTEMPVKYDMEDWLELMGWYISEGYVENKSKSLHICQQNEDGRESISALLERMDIPYTSNQKEYQISSQTIGNWFVENCGSSSYDKKIPEFVFELDSHYLECLLWSLVEGDGSGSLSLDSSVCYTTVSEKLKEDVMKLALICGYKASYREHSEHSHIYQIDISEQGGSFKKSDGESIQHEGEVYCITAKDNHTIMAGRNGKFSWIGQCDKLTFSNWRSKSLEYVSNEELGIGKIDDVDINTDWEKRPSRLIAYNIVDVILTVALDDTNGIHEFFYEIADVSSIPIYDTFYEKRLVDGYVMSRRGDDEILPTADESELVENAGGYVDDPANGRMQNIGVSDLKSLYPSAMITWNISTETVAESPEDFDNYVRIPKVPEPKNVTGGIKEKDIEWDWLYASLDKEGLIPRTLKKLFKKRNREKEKMYAAEDGSAEQSKWDRKQGSTKVIMNSFYGNASSKYWRLSNQFLGDAVTSTARYTLWKGRKTIEKLGYEAVYGDTDSHFIQLTRDTIEGQIDELKEISHEMDADASEIFNDIYVPKCGECNNEVMWDEEQSEYYCPVHDKANIPDKHPLLVDADLHGDAKTCMKWEPEKIYSAWMQLGRKKRYAGNIRWKEGTLYEENISISGFENQRSDSPEITASLQKKVIGMILKGEDFVTVSDYLQSVIGEIDKKSDNVEKFALPGSINKPLEEYPNRETPRACMWSNENIDKEFGEGDDPFVYYVKETPSALPQTDVLALEWTDEIPEGFELDKEAIIERAVRKPIDSIINEMDWKFSELRSGKRQQKKDFSTDGSNPFA